MIKNELVAVHPGVYIKDALEELGMSQNEFAVRLGMLPKTMSTLINGNSSITFDIAKKLSTFFNNSVQFWMNLQVMYDVYLYECEMKKEVEREWQIVKLFDKEFLLDLFGIKLDKNDRENIIRKLKDIFMVSSLENLKSQDMFAFCRTSVLKDVDEKQIILRNAWISCAMYKANKIECNEFNVEYLNKNLSKIKELTLEEPEIFMPKLHKYLNEAGIKFIGLPYLKGSNVSGVTKWCSKDRTVMIAINDCGKDADKIWFNIFHELGHAFKNHKRHLTLSLEKGNIEDEDEIAANDFAKNNLLDRKEYAKFIEKGDFSINCIEKFAKEQKVATFIVVGRLQKDGYIPWNKYHDYKKKYDIKKITS